MDLCRLVLCHQSIQSLFHKNLLTTGLIRMRVKIINEPLCSAASVILDKPAGFLDLKDRYIRTCIFQGELCEFQHLYVHTCHILARACFLRDVHWFRVFSEFSMGIIYREAALMTDIPEIQARALVLGSRYPRVQNSILDIVGINWTPGLREIMLEHLISHEDIDNILSAYLGGYNPKNDNTSKFYHITGSVRFGFPLSEKLRMDPKHRRLFLFLAGQDVGELDSQAIDLIKHGAFVFHLTHPSRIPYLLEVVDLKTIIGIVARVPITYRYVENVTIIYKIIGQRNDEESRRLILLCKIILGMSFNYNDIALLFPHQRHDHDVSREQIEMLLTSIGHHQAKVRVQSNFYFPRIMYDPKHLLQVQLPHNPFRITHEIWARGQFLNFMSRSGTDFEWGTSVLYAPSCNPEVKPNLPAATPNMCTPTIQLLRLLYKYGKNQYPRCQCWTKMDIGEQKIAVAKFHGIELSEDEIREIEKEEQRKKR